MQKVRAKKNLGQHFLTNQDIAARIANGFTESAPNVILEIGPGMGILTRHLIRRPNADVRVVEIDHESVCYLMAEMPELNSRIIEGDFLKLDLPALFGKPISVAGNFPYNISSQILFKILENRQMVPQMVGMFQKEVAERVASNPGSKVYGILSVLLQAYYNIDYLFTVNECEFDPPPKVKSGVIRLTRNNVEHLPCDEELFTKVVKTSFNQRRKTLSNSLKPILQDRRCDLPVFRQRPEQLSVDEFVELTNIISEMLNRNI